MESLAKKLVVLTFFLSMLALSFIILTATSVDQINTLSLAFYDLFFCETFANGAAEGTSFEQTKGILEGSL
jgi:hypothetical protein